MVIALDSQKSNGAFSKHSSPSITFLACTKYTPGLDYPVDYTPLFPLAIPSIQFTQRGSCHAHPRPNPWHSRLAQPTICALRYHSRIFCPTCACNLMRPSVFKIGPFASHCFTSAHSNGHLWCLPTLPARSARNATQ